MQGMRYINNFSTFSKKSPMIDYEALFRVSYGLYVVCSGTREHGNGFISNTVFQVTAEPPRFAACCHKNNYTAEFITRCGAFSVSVLHKDAAPGLFGRFGYRSGRDLDKMEGVEVRYGDTDSESSEQCGRNGVAAGIGDLIGLHVERVGSVIEVVPSVGRGDAVRRGDGRTI